MLDDLWREAMATIADFGNRQRLARHHVDGIPFYVTMPPDESCKGFVLLFPDIDGCKCEGKSVHDCMKKAAPTLADGLVALERQAVTVPMPRTFDELMEDRAWESTLRKEKLAVVAVTLEADVTVH